jgi:hypothetical protein
LALNPPTSSNCETSTNQSVRTGNSQPRHNVRRKSTPDFEWKFLSDSNLNSIHESIPDTDALHLPRNAYQSTNEIVGGMLTEVKDQPVHAWNSIRFNLDPDLNEIDESN